MLNLPASELAMLAALMLAGGALTGFLGGLFGVGGGAVIVPILYEVFGALGVPESVRMQLCVGSSLAIIIPTSIRSFLAHKAKGAVDMSILRIWAAPVFLGVIAGGLLARYANANVFKAVFVLVAGASAIRLLFARDGWKIADTMPGRAVMSVYGALIGLLSALMGIGGGQLSNLFMTFYGRPIHQAVATSSGLGPIISLPGALGAIYAGWPEMALLPPLSLGYVSLIAFALFIPTSIWAAPLGAKLAHSLPKRQLEVSFGIFLLLVSLRIAWTMVR